MKQAKIIDFDVDKRIKTAILDSLDIYLNQLRSGFLETGLEDAFKMHLANIISSELEQKTFFIDERFVVLFEKNMLINGNNDYIDIVIKYQRANQIRYHFIELKYKKISDSAPDLGVLNSYIDMYNLDSHRQNTSDVYGCYFIFLTDLKTYLNKPYKGTRFELPMHNGAQINKHVNYSVTGKTAKKESRKYPKGFVFSKDHTIDYHEFKVGDRTLWYFFEEM
jgi:hypothetical protein